jgi:hypothetical protein
LAASDTKLDTFSLLTLFTLWNYSSTHWAFSIPFTALFGFALFYPNLRVSWMFWSVTTALLGFLIGQLWASEGNAMFLFFYTGLTLTLALTSKNTWEVVRINARYLIGLVFLLATLWKVFSPDFMSSKFMEYILLEDTRIAPVAVLLTSLRTEDVRKNQEQLLQLPETSIVLKTAPNVRELAILLTYLTILVEGLVAFTFLLPVKPFVRDGMLVAFLVGSYLTVTVPSFGMIIACLGFAQTPNSRMQTLYKVLCLLMPLILLRIYLTR